MKPLSRGRYEARLATTEAEVAEAQALRHLAFRAARGLAAGHPSDRDAFDAQAQHMLIRDRDGGELVGCYRVQQFCGADLGQSYAAQFYDLQRLAGFPGPMLELGRFCLHPDRHDPDILRLAWAALTRLVDAAGVGLLFGCSSFAGADPQRHRAALGLLCARTAPDHWRPGPRAPHRISLAPCPPGTAADGLQQMPALLRTYLSMGGWVSDHAVVDHDLDTLHVLTGVEIAAIPPSRARALRLIAADAMG